MEATGQSPEQLKSDYEILNNIERTAIVPTNSQFANIRKYLIYAVNAFGFASALITVFQHFNPLHKELTVYYTSDRPQLISKDLPDNLSLVLNGRHISEDVFLANIFVYNNGSVSIKRSDVFKQVSISLPATKILNAKVVATSRDECGIKVEKTTLKESSFLLDFDFLEKMDYGKIQIIYEGKVADDIEVNGTIDGQKDKSISVVASSAKKTIESKKGFTSRNPFVTSFLFMIGIFFGSQFIVLAGCFFRKVFAYLFFDSLKSLKNIYNPPVLCLIFPELGSVKPEFKSLVKEDLEASLIPFFFYCRKQSVLYILIAGLVCFMLDKLLYNQWEFR
ncbi:MAG: hypothetical protein WCJ40_15285 [Planctomycetota bacterium]